MSTQQRTDGALGLPGMTDLIAALARDGAAPRRLELYAAWRGDGIEDLAEPSADPGAARRVHAAVAAVALRQGGSAYALGATAFAFLLPVATPPGVAAAAHRALQAINGRHREGFLSVCAIVPDEARPGPAAVALALRRLRAAGADHGQGPRRQARAALLALLDERGDGELRARRPAVVAAAVAVGRRLGLDGGELVDLAAAVELADLAGLVTPPGATAIRGTTAVAGRVVAAAPALAGAGAILHALEERFDGSGQPDGLAGPRIPLGARIVTVCLAYERLARGRAVVPGAPPDPAALRALAAAAVTRLDPVVVAVFHDVLLATAARDEWIGRVA